MARRFHPRSSPAENLRNVINAIPWRLLLLIPILLVAALPVFLFGARAGQKVLPAITHFFYNISAPPPLPTPTPLPPLTRMLPQAGSLLYTVQAGDSCDEILAFQMHMVDAGQIFSDAN